MVQLIILKHLKKRLEGFQTETNKRYFFDDINTTWSDKFQQYLYNQELANNTIYQTFDLLINFLNHFYQRRKELNINLTDNFREKGWKQVKPNFSNPVPLTRAEIDAVLKYKPTKDLQVAYDMAVLQIHTGLHKLTYLK